MKRLAAIGICCLASLAACGDGSPAGGDEAVSTTGDERFRLEIRTSGSPTSGELDVQVTPRGEWHLALDAPARIRLEPVSPAEAARCKPSPARIERAEAREASEAKLHFETSWTGEVECTALEGTLKFGLCYGDSTRCTIVRERFGLAPCATGLCPEG